MHRWIAAAAFALAVAACGGGEAAVPREALPSPTASTAATTTTTTTLTTPTTAAEQDAPAPTVTPALGIAVSAGDSFDQGHLVADAGSRFVPMDDPVMVAASEVTWLDDDAIVMGVVRRGEAQAFPVSQMAWHHIANTTIAGEPYLVTY